MQPKKYPIFTDLGCVRRPQASNNPRKVPIEEPVYILDRLIVANVFMRSGPFRFDWFYLSTAISLYFAAGGKQVRALLSFENLVSHAHVRSQCWIKQRKASRFFAEEVTAMDAASEGNERPVHVLRILALHGSEGNAESMKQVLEDWQDYIDSQKDRDPVQLDVTTLQAPFSKGSGYAWWLMDPGFRSFTATSYHGFEESAVLVTDEIVQNGPFDLIMGHSQGAILLTALLATERLIAPRVLLNGVAWPNPFTSDLCQLTKLSSPPDIMLLIGDADRINPPEQAARVEKALKDRGCSVTTIHHPRGHSVPNHGSDPVTVKSAIEWMLPR